MAKAQLPQGCYFRDSGPPCNRLWNDIEAAGFDNVVGAESADPAGQVWITPPGLPKTQLSPPGNNTSEAYDITSQIELVAVMHA